MYDFEANADQPKAEFYRELVSAADALTAGEPDGIANMANVAALLWQLMPELNWAGFYRALGGANAFRSIARTIGSWRLARPFSRRCRTGNGRS